PQSSAAHRPLHPFPTRRSSDLHHQAAQEVGEIRNDAILEIQHGISADLPAPALEDAPKHFYVPGFIGTLARNGQPHIPVGVGKIDRKSTRLNSSHVAISYAVFC